MREEIHQGISMGHDELKTVLLKFWSTNLQVFVVATQAPSPLCFVDQSYKGQLSPVF